MFILISITADAGVQDLAGSTQGGGISILPGQALGSTIPIPPVCVGNNALQWTGSAWRCKAIATSSGSSRATSLTYSGFAAAFRNYMGRTCGRGRMGWNGSTVRCW